MRNKNIRNQKSRRHINKVEGKQNTIGARIRKLRLAAKPKISQDDLAGRLAAQGILLNRTAIAKIEAGTRSLRDFEVIAIAKALRLPMASLFGNEASLKLSSLTTRGSPVSRF